MVDAKKRPFPGFARRGSRLATAIVAVAIGGLLAGCGGEPAAVPTAGGDSDDPLAALYEEALATAGGKVVLYTHLSGTEEQIAIAQAFGEAYPGLTLEVTGLNGQQLIERFLTEKRSGLNLVDVIKYPGLAPFENEFQDEGFLEPYTPSSADEYTIEGTYVEGLAYPWSTYEQGACYNPDMITDKELKLLQTYEGWADPVFEGRAAISMPTGGTYLRGWDYWLEEDPNLGEDWLQDIKDNVNPTAFSNGNNAADRVAAGEYAVAYGVNSNTAIRAAGTGAPLKCARQEYTVVIAAPVALATDAPNPAGGKLFIEWMLSKEGQLFVINTIGNLSARSDLFGVPPERIPDWPTPNELVANDEAVVAETQGEVVDLFTSLFGSGQ